mmetsp:Transcript_71506/g.198481  ORF Transcript_71506/g.198481 Transcript_71506/m.198481 type:complete len:305 (-) Transcript_71506:261-1175(-)
MRWRFQLAIATIVLPAPLGRFGCIGAELVVTNGELLHAWWSSKHARLNQGQRVDVGAVRKRGRVIRFVSMHVLLSIFWRGNYTTWEDTTFDILERFSLGQVVLDIGAWVGPTALWTAHLARKVIALEPSNRAFQLLRASLEFNPEISHALTLVEAALDADDGVSWCSDVGDGRDSLGTPGLGRDSRVRSISIATLRWEHPELEGVGFIKMDVEGHEATLVPALRAFLEEKRPAMLVALHPRILGPSRTQALVDLLQDIFPYLYEPDMKSPFDTTRSDYALNAQAGADVLGTWSLLHQAVAATSH